MVFHKKRHGGDVAAIFVHAGAGFHSIQNEKIHLDACAEAAKAAMAFLRNGASAVDAVEIAIKVLEDKEITNAGYGSNLTRDGQVECDATIVDHYGRSGAVGAVGQILNPIHVARLVLEHSSRPLSLRRVPPNLLVGQGAADFAFECGVPVLPPAYLISGGARERYRRWQRDLSLVEQKQGTRLLSNSESSDLDQESKAQKGLTEETEDPQLAGLRIESQSYSPQIQRGVDRNDEKQTHSSLLAGNIRKPVPAALPSSSQPKFGDQFFLREHGLEDCGGWTSPPLPPQGNDGYDSQILCPPEHDGDSEGKSITDEVYSSLPNLEVADSELSILGPQSRPNLPEIAKTSQKESSQSNNYDNEDTIIDTVGAIAIDILGNIAAGSSSGGIGMKHKGRTGPAALIGVGTCVLPVDGGDKNKTCVATVTSGTGEHMATTMAASTCANRLLLCQKRGKHGSLVDASEDEAIRTFIEADFMDHPSVTHSSSVGAIGVMAVKKTKDGLWLHFAHNTDSFALSSMKDDDEEPHCVMSRTKRGNKVTTGGRSLTFLDKKPISTATASTSGEPKTKRQRMDKPSKTKGTDPVPTHPHVDSLSIGHNPVTATH